MERQLSGMLALADKYDMLPPGCRVLCAVSGGVDSLALLHALNQLRRRRPFTLIAAHYNHHLRGDDSDRDARFVSQFVSLCCGACPLPGGGVLPAVELVTGEGDVAGEAARRGLGLEETAREMRYAFLTQQAQRLGCDRIATAHHAGDNAETVLLHLTRGSGLHGLTGIRPRRGALIRPLLSTSRSELEDYLAYYGLPHVEDHSNRDLRFARNRLRAQVLPVLTDLNPRFLENLEGLTGRLRADDDYLEEQARRALKGHVRAGAHAVEVEAACLAGLPPALAPRAARQLIALARGGWEDASAAHLQALLELAAREDAPSASLDLPGLRVQRLYDWLSLSPPAPCAPLPALPLPLPGEMDWGGWHISARQAIYDGEPHAPLSFHLACPALTLRPRRTGDTLRLPGRGTKTIKKLMIECKIPRPRRDAWPVLDVSGAAAALAGFGPDARFLPQRGEPCWHIIITPPDGPGEIEKEF